MTKQVVLKRRCAVYTRKSSEEGLDMEFNSLDAQRESSEAYVASQKPEGWVLVPDRYDDGGFSGGTLERPALRRLLADIEAGRVDVIVVYKIDRLSRSLMDFARLVEVFDRKGVTFVSVTQSFNTTTSMGRLTLNILLSFAQFEREVIGERIRDKFAASRRKGIWMGGWAPLGYEVKDRKLIINETEAAKVRHIFERFAKCRSATMVARDLAAENFVNKYGKSIDKGMLYKLLHNRVYVGDAVHKGTAYPGEHEAIVPVVLWDKVHCILVEGPRSRAGRTRAQAPALLKGLIFGPDGRAMSPTHTRKGQKLYRYYVSQAVIKGELSASPINRVPAAEIERAVIDQLRILLRSPEIIVATCRAARKENPGITEAEVRDAVGRLDPVWDELFPAEQARIVRLLVERVQVEETGVDISLRVGGLTSLVADLRAGIQQSRRLMPTANHLAADPDAITVRVPIVFRRRGGRKALITPDGSPSITPPRVHVDDAMVKAIARAFRWRRLIENGVYAGVAEIAAVERVNDSYVSRVVRLTLLAPDIVDAIMDGRQPADITIAALMSPSPPEWEYQLANFTRTSAETRLGRIA